VDASGFYFRKLRETLIPVVRRLTYGLPQVLAMRNQVLKLLPSREYSELLSNVTLVTLEQKAVLHEPGRVIDRIYFPEDAVISYMAGTGDASMEVCVVGHEGVVGVSALLAEGIPLRAVVQLPGRAYAIDRDVLKKFMKESENLRELLLAYINLLLAQIAQTGICSKFHGLETRFCRWLLMADDRLGARKLSLRQEDLALLLGNRRPGVSMIASALQKRGAIRCRRGTIEILDRKQLERAACECYKIMSAPHFLSGID